MPETDDFLVEDESVDDVIAAFEAGEKHQTKRPLRPGITVLMAAHPARLSNGMVNEAFSSITAQTMQPDTVIMVNDLERKGAGRTRQKLLRMVETEWLAWCDSDDALYPNHLADLHKVAIETNSVYVYSWFDGGDPLGHFGLPFDPCRPHHSTITVLARTDLAQEVGFYESQRGQFSNEDWGWITGFAKLCCERGLKMTHVPIRSWHYRQGHGNSSGQPGRGDAR